MKSVRWPLVRNSRLFRSLCQIIPQIVPVAAAFLLILHLAVPFMQLEAFPQNVSRAFCTLKILIARETMRDRHRSRHGSHGALDNLSLKEFLSLNDAAPTTRQRNRRMTENLSNLSIASFSSGVCLERRNSD
jgi:hypothetical protein